MTRTGNEAAVRAFTFPLYGLLAVTHGKGHIGLHLGISRESARAHRHAFQSVMEANQRAPASSPSLPRLATPADDAGRTPLQRMVLYITRAALQSGCKGDERCLYHALQTYCAGASVRQTRAAALRVSPAEVHVVLTLSLQLLLEATTMETSGALHHQASSLAMWIAHTPLVSLERVRTHLRTCAPALPHGVAVLLGSALAEVMQLSAVLDELLGLPRSPLGTVPVVSLAALALSLQPAQELSDLMGVLSTACEAFQFPAVPEDREGEDSRRDHVTGMLAAGVLYAWSVLDHRHGRALHGMAERVREAVVERHPGVPLRFPELLAASSGEEVQLARSAPDPMLAAEAPVHPEWLDAPPASESPPLLVAHSWDEAGALEERAEMSSDRSVGSTTEEGIDEGFWHRLVS